jgi:hypothetical protein
MVILWMEVILHHLGWVKPYKYWDQPSIIWCRISQPATLCTMVKKKSGEYLLERNCRPILAELPWVHLRESATPIDGLWFTVILHLVNDG